MALERGRVIALRRGAAGMIWSSNPTHAWVVPIGGYNGPPPHRAEVRFDDPAEILSCGVSFRYPVARAHMMFELAIDTATKAEVLGAAPAALIARIVRAISREAEARAMERRHHFSDPVSRFSAALL